MSKIKFNFVQRNGFTFLFRFERWNRGDYPEEIRVMFLFWEFNFCIFKEKYKFECYEIHVV